MFSERSTILLNNCEAYISMLTIKKKKKKGRVGTDHFDIIMSLGGTGNIILEYSRGKLHEL